MKMLIDLFSTDYGLMSLAVIVIVLAIAAYFVRLFLGRGSSADEKKPATQAGR